MTATAVRDRRLLYVTAFLRAVTTSTIGVTSGAYLATLGLDPTALGAVISYDLLREFRTSRRSRTGVHPPSRRA